MEALIKTHVRGFCINLCINEFDIGELGQPSIFIQVYANQKANQTDQIDQQGEMFHLSLVACLITKACRMDVNNLYCVL